MSEPQYYPSTISNLKLEVLLNSQHPDPQLHSMLRDLTDKLVIKHPKWDFIAPADSTRLMGGNIPLYRELIVQTQHFPPQRVGTINIETRYTNKGSEAVYALRSPRIRRNRERGDAVMTTKLASAIKVVNKLFTAAPVTEEIEDAEVKAWTLMDRAASYANYEMNDLAQSVSPYVHQFVSAHPAEFMAWLPNEEARALVTRLADAKVNKNAVYSMKDDWKNMLTVLTVGDKYVVRKVRGEGEVVTYSVNEVSEHIRKCVGMLKLSEEGAVLHGIGVRVNSKTFVIVNN